MATRAGIHRDRQVDWGIGGAVLGMAAAGLAIVILATARDALMLDYGVGIVPAIVPWVAAVLAIAAAGVAASGRSTGSTTGTLLLAALGVAVAWSVVMLPFDGLRVVRLVPLPVSLAGMGLRVLLLVAGASVLVPAMQARRVRQARCPSCGRVVPGPLDRLPRWPGAVALLAALVYPVLRTLWALGGTFGTSEGPVELDPAVAWGAATVGWLFVAFTLILLVGRGPRWARALLGLGGVVAGMAMALVGGLATIRVASLLATDGLGSTQGDGLMTWTFLLVYGSWFVAGLGVIASGWRYWAHRRDHCPKCVEAIS